MKVKPGNNDKCMCMCELLRLHVTDQGRAISVYVCVCARAWKSDELGSRNGREWKIPRNLSDTREVKGEEESEETPLRNL